LSPRRPLLDNLQLEQARRSDDVFRALDVGHAGQLDQDLIGALLRDDRLGDAKLVDAALDRLPRLHDRFVRSVSWTFGFSVKV
jgi:hypothetical protein